MRKVLFAGVGFVLLAGAAGGALAQSDGAEPRQFGLFRADANEDGAVTREEYDASRAARFNALDANDDGQLTRAEMRAGREEHSRRGGRRGAYRFEGADVDGDGNVSRDEFLARPIRMFERLDTNDDGIINTAERPQRDRMDSSRRADADDDRFVSQAEYAARSAERFDRLDANDDGRITRAEVEAVRGRRHGG